jgi:diguanylate cyclase (GGDEF)-like protein
VDTIDFSSVAVSFETVGTLLLASVLAQLGRMFGWRYVRRWALAWMAMFLALFAIRAFITTQHRELWVVYLAGEWAFLVLLYAGSRELVDGHRVQLKYAAWIAPLALAFAALLMQFARTFNDVFIVEAAIVSGGVFVSFLTLGRVAPHRRTAGWQTMRASMGAMTTLFAAYVPLYILEAAGFKLWFLPYSSLADLLGLIFLGFGMILVTTEEANRELQDAVTALSIARDQLQRKLDTDPLTEALSRHAFLAMPRGMTGVAIMVDIDHLKLINDQRGHETGDAVIRAAANAIRSRIRADDLLFRWGGDEFLVVVPNSTIDVVSARLAPLADGIRVDLPRARDFLFTISWGGSEFGRGRTLEIAMREADASMYERRAARRTA